MGSFATAADVATEIGKAEADLTPVDAAQIELWIDRVEGRLEGRIPTLSAIASTEAGLKRIRGVVVAIVGRRAQFGDGLTMQTIDDYSWQRSGSQSVDTSLWPLPEEWAELMPGTTGRKAFTIRPGR